MDHMEQRTVNFSGLEVLILDEADRMLDMGFIPAVRRILRALPTSRQTLFFSATMPPEIERIVRDTLRSPTVIEIGPRSRPVDTVRQVVCPVHSDMKRDLLCHLLKDGDLRHVLVFTRTKARAERLAKHLARTGRRVASIHGNKSQGARVQALSRFRTGQIDVLVATDIAARGIDVDGISHVINFDVPNVPEDYVHRIGRTARAEATGDAISLVSEEEAPYVRSIEKLTGIPIPRKVVAGFEVGPWAARPAPSPSHEPGRRPRDGSQRPGAHRGAPRRSPQTAGNGGATGGRPARRHRTGGSRGYSGRR
jgi:ATP-dependent RNA helicase RhlE